MNPHKRRYSKQQFARRGDAIYERDILPRLTEDDKGKYVLIDIETGDYEIDDDQLAASDRLWKRHPKAQPWLRRVGYRHAHTLAGRNPPEVP